MGESSIRRAVADTFVGAIHTARHFWVVEVLGGGALGAFLGVWLTPPNATRLEQLAYPVIGVIIGIGIPLAFLLLWNLHTAPYRQRDEATEANKKQDARIAELEARYEQPQMIMELDDACRVGREVRIRLRGNAIKAKPFLAEIAPAVPSIMAGEPLWCDGDVAHVPLQLGGMPRYIELLSWGVQNHDILVRINGTRNQHMFKPADKAVYRFRIQVDDLGRQGAACSHWFELRREGLLIEVAMVPESTGGTQDSQAPTTVPKYPEIDTGSPDC